ncbi:MAG: hypothetical protein V1929_00115 [bacterium]
MNKAVADSHAAEKWVWKASGPQPPAPKRMSIAAKTAIQVPLMLLVAFLLYHYGHRVGPAIIVTLAALVFVGGFIYAPLFHGFETFGALLAKWVSSGLTWGLLVPFYYIVFVPARLILALTGNDPMTRGFPTQESTYWIPRPPVRNMEQYRKQH